MQKKVIFQTMNDFQITQNFNLKEFECPCCGLVMIDNRLVDFLQSIRNDYGSPILIDSGYRCERHNLYIGGTEGSYHLFGLAADITTENAGSYNDLWAFLGNYQNRLKILPHPDKIYFHVQLK